MEEPKRKKEFVRRISSLWNEQKRREALYLSALKKDDMGAMRRMFSQGHFSAVLFQKEIHSIYDYFKCFLTDKDLDKDVEINYETIIVLDGLDGKEQVVGYLKKMEAAMLQSYKMLYKYLDVESDTRRVIDEHLNRISEFYETLSRQETSIKVIKDFKPRLAVTQV